MLVVIDLSSLYFSIREMSITLNYEKLCSYLREEFGDDLELHAFTVADIQNTSQTRFLDKLEKLGITTHIYGFDTPAKFSVEIMAWGAKSDANEIMFISGDGDLIRAYEFLAKEKKLRLCFFSEKISPKWNPKILSGEVDFTDLSKAETRKRISGNSR